MVAVAAGTAALALGGHGLLVPAGPSSTLVRVGGALIALAAVAALVRLDGPARGARTLTLVAVAGALTGLATLPVSPVSLDDAPGAAPAVPERSPDEGGAGTIWLDRPGAEQGGAGDPGTLVLPPGASLEVDGDDLLLRLPDGSAAVLGDAGRAAGPGTAPAPGQRAGVQAGPSGRGGGVSVTRSDGRPLGPGVGLGGVPFEGPDGRRVVVGGGVLLDVPEPLPAEPDAGVDDVADGVEAVLALLLAGFALLAFAPPVVRVAGRIAEPAAVADPPTPRAPAPATSATVEEGLAEVLRAMLADPDPRTAVIGAYARLLAALDEVGFARRAEEGPHEHLWRALGPLGVRRAPLHRLAELFVRARFTPRPVTEVHRQTAIRCLADAVGDLRLQDGEVEALVGAPALAAQGGPGA
ncbi:MAG TPA: DUF4129 domain-containing protein [Acidimicrobiales bacterium]|nr:DUF4129 domain-containing protein [Acidimicrobiales bacterium]